ncbi:MAG: type I glutamate--ammonia ligase [Chloroflexi bacterium]|nr:type I glutamate--ammonia ligase [Chloroflexota bacterium]
MFYSVNQVLQLVQEGEIQFINLQFSDIVGLLKSITLPAKQLEQAFTNGVWFDGSSIEGFARVSESDMFLVPDPASFAIIPWRDGAHKTARLICNVYTPDGDEFIGSPRGALKRTVAEAAKLGYSYQVGPEYEFFLFGTDDNGDPDPDVIHDHAGYFDSTADRATLVRQDMINALEALGIEVETGHHECAPGQHEIDFRYSDALSAADNSITFKYVLKTIAQKHNLYASFMPKPLMSVPGSGMHCHQSLCFLETGSNAFADAADPYGLSKTAKQFIAGQLAHARGMSAIVAPLVNSYKRLVPGYEAPIYVSWARINRSALIRVPRSNNSNVRLELRCPDPSCNPYLALAVMLAAGLDGIVNDLPLPDPTEEDLFESEWARHGLQMLPRTLREALDELERDTVIQQALGPHILERFVDAKTQEWEDYRVDVSSWERNRYLRIF